MPPDACNIDSCSGSHATRLGSASISSSPVFSSPELEIPMRFPSPPAGAPRGSMCPSTPDDTSPPAPAPSLVPAFHAAETAKPRAFVVCAEGWSVLQKAAWVNRTGQELRRHGFHQMQSPYICLFSIVLSHLLCSLTGLLDGEKVRGPRWTIRLYANPSVIVRALQPTFDKPCSSCFSMANIKCCVRISKVTITCKI